MTTTTIKPRFCETDALGHINNVSYAIWSEQARADFMDTHAEMWDWSLVLVKLDINYRAEAFYGHTVTVETNITKIGTSSITKHCRLEQKGAVIAEVDCVLVKYDFDNKRSIPLNTEQLAYLHRIGDLTKN